jgi:hypothetical protein
MSSAFFVGGKGEFMIVSIRGCGGSGKSTVARGLLRLGCTQVLRYGALLGPQYPEAHALQFGSVGGPVHLIGPYLTEETAGCDYFRTQKRVRDVVLAYRQRGHAVFEGSASGDDYGELMQALEPYGREIVIAFLTTPLVACLARCARRHGWTGNAADVARSHDDNIRLLARVRKDKIFRVEKIDSETGSKAILQWLTQDRLRRRGMVK